MKNTKVCAHCNQLHHEENEGYPNLCKGCRGEQLARDKMAARIRTSGVVAELRTIVTQQEKLNRRVDRANSILVELQKTGKAVTL